MGGGGSINRGQNIVFLSSVVSDYIYSFFGVFFKQVHVEDVVEAHRREVYLKVSILNIIEVDTLKESFTADVFYQARWREPKLDGNKVKFDLFYILGKSIKLKSFLWRFIKRNYVRISLYIHICQVFLLYYNCDS